MGAVRLLVDAVKFWAFLETVHLVRYFYVSHKMQKRGPKNMYPLNRMVESLKLSLSTVIFILDGGDQPRFSLQGAREQLGDEISDPLDLEQMLRTYVPNQDDRAVDLGEMLELKRALIRRWFFGAEFNDIRQENVESLIAWGFWNLEREQIPVGEERQKLHELTQIMANFCELDHFPAGHNPDVHPLRLTFDPVKSFHRPLFGYVITMPVVDYCTYYLFKWRAEFRDYKTGTLQYWHRPPKAAPSLLLNKEPIVFVHGVGIGILPYYPFIQQLIDKFGDDRDIFLVSLPHIAMRLGEALPSDSQITASIADMLKLHGFEHAHFIGHSFGTAVVSGLIHQQPSLVWMATLIDPIPFLLDMPDLFVNFFIKYVIFTFCVQTKHF